MADPMGAVPYATTQENWATALSPAQLGPSALDPREAFSAFTTTLPYGLERRAETMYNPMLTRYNVGLGGRGDLADADYYRPGGTGQMSFEQFLAGYGTPAGGHTTLPTGVAVTPDTTGARYWAPMSDAEITDRIRRAGELAVMSGRDLDATLAPSALGELTPGQLVDQALRGTYGTGSQAVSNQIAAANWLAQSQYGTPGQIAMPLQTGLSNQINRSYRARQLAGADPTSFLTWFMGNR